ncbi:hypothetical protein [Arthrobacter sp. ES1]|uniref:hypothetical protein n=1 Tax=Arthrobacter sp. ES1 TaxID=1897056 RepID=UPI001CFFB4A1|nr:hypothetical protein [Arthrobacter sp. ES1]MCB5281115.1 hypothetical protein [Arthrobacter sp. ES1]
MSTTADALDAMKARSEGLTDLCAEHLRQGIRHLQRNCHIECNVHEDVETDACRHPAQGDGDRMAASLADLPRLFAAVEAVLKLHTPFVWDFGFGPVTSCRGCADQGASEAAAEYPCPTITALLGPLRTDA